MEPLSACSSLDTFEMPDRFGVNTLVGSLQALSSSITKLQLRNCEAEGGNLLKLEVLSQLQSLKDLELSNSRFDFGKLCTSRALSQLTRLVVQCVSVLQYHDVLHLSALQVLHMQCSVFHGGPDVTWLLSDILCHLRYLQELNVIGCDPLSISPADCQEVNLSAFSFEYSQLDNPDKSSFKQFLLDRSAPATLSKPYLRIDGMFASCLTQEWVLQLPFRALTHLTIHEAQEWPTMLLSLNESGVQKLRVLHICFVVDPIVSKAPFFLGELDRPVHCIQPICVV